MAVLKSLTLIPAGFEFLRVLVRERQLHYKNYIEDKSLFSYSYYYLIIIIFLKSSQHLARTQWPIDEYTRWCIKIKT